MNISKKEALESIQSIERVSNETKRTLNALGGDLLLILWGAIWIIGFLITHLDRQFSGPAWGVLDLAGAIGTGWIVYKSFKTFPVKGPAGRTLGRNIGILWFVATTYAYLFPYLLSAGEAPNGTMNYVAYGCAMIMFVYILMGLMIPSRLADNYLLWVGLFVTAVIAVAFAFFRNSFYLWMAIGGGGTLFFTGLYLAIRYRWRRVNG